MVAVVGGAGCVVALGPGRSHDGRGSGERTAVTRVQGAIDSGQGIHAGDGIAVGVVALVAGGEDTATRWCAVATGVGLHHGGQAR